MSRGRALRWMSARLPGVDDRVRDDLVESVDQISRTASRRERSLELLSLVGLALTAWSRHGARDDRGEMLRQGARLAAVVLCAGEAASGWAAGSDGAAALATALVIALAGGLQATAVGLAIALVVAAAPTGGLSAVLLGLVVTAAAAVSRPFDARRCPAGAAVAAGAMSLLAVGATLWPSHVEGAIVALSAITVVVFLAAGWFDPRFAVGATIVCAWRLLAIDLGDLGPAVLAAVDRAELDLLIVRWALMGAGVAAGWFVASASLDRCLTTER